MTARRATVQEKIADWFTAYRAILDEIQHPFAPSEAFPMTADGGFIVDGRLVGSTVIQNDPRWALRRTAAIAAAMIVAPGGIAPSSRDMALTDAIREMAETESVAEESDDAIR